MPTHAASTTADNSPWPTGHAKLISAAYDELVLTANYLRQKAHDMEGNRSKYLKNLVAGGLNNREIDQTVAMFRECSGVGSLGQPLQSWKFLGEIKVTDVEFDETRHILVSKAPSLEQLMIAQGVV